MAARKDSAQAPKAAETAPAPAPANDQGELGLADLARAILARQIRPRVGQVRQLAEAVLAREEKRSRKKAKAGEGKKKRKLAKIPGQKSAKKPGPKPK